MSVKAVTQEEIALFQKYRSASPEQRTAILGFMQRAVAREMPLRENAMRYFAEIGVDGEEAKQNVNELMAKVAKATAATSDGGLPT